MSKRRHELLTGTIIDLAVGPIKAAKGEITYIRRQVLPQAPSPTMTSLRRISAMVADGYLGLRDGDVDVRSKGKRWPSSVYHSGKERNVGGKGWEEAGNGSLTLQ